MKKLVLAAATLAFLAGAPAVAQTAAPAAQAPAATPAKPAKAAPKADKPRSAASLDCSKQADAKGLHGKDRKKFRSACMKDAKAGDKKM